MSTPALPRPCPGAPPTLAPPTAPPTASPSSLLCPLAQVPTYLISVALGSHPQPLHHACMALTICCLCPSPRVSGHPPTTSLGSHFIPLPGPAELDLQRTLSLQAPPVKEGPLFIHRTKGKGHLMSSFKKLHFSLTTEALSFAKTPSSKVGEEGGGQVGIRGVYNS